MFFLGKEKRAGRRCCFSARGVCVVLMKSVAWQTTNKAVNRYPQIVVNAEMLEIEGGREHARLAQERSRSLRPCPNLQYI